jgi:TolB-like protein/class 3 adenylate cyclase/Flp pilus assembly protein TadD
MSAEQVERRLAAILAADVAGYSRLMGQDEAGTLARLRTHYRELINPKIAECKGRIVKNTGDGFLAEFQSVVEAVACAVAVQRDMADRNTAIQEDQRMEFRIGINLGDVMVADRDIHGDGVNVAARLEGLATPGGICISAIVRDQVQGRLDCSFEDMGEQNLKNIARPVRVYRVRPDLVAEMQAATAQPLSMPRRVAPAILTMMTVLILIIAGLGWRFWPATTSSPTSPTVGTSAQTKPAVSAPVVAPRLSIVVLPFNNLSNDPEQQYFVDGITEDLTTDLSRIGGSFVISSNTAFTYKGKSVDAKQIGRELGVHYVLEGSVQRSGKQVRVNAQLIDAATDAHLWAERFERDVGDLFALQNEITGRIAIALNLALVNAEARRPTEHPDAVDYIFRGVAEFNKPASRESRDEAIALFEHALTIDPHSATAQSFLALAVTARVLDGMSTSDAADIARAEGLVEQALATSPTSLLAHRVKAEVLRAKTQNLGMQNQCDEAILEYETVLASNPNWAAALWGLANCKFYTGSIEEAVSLAEKSILLSPHDPNIWFPYFQIGRTRLLQSRIDEAIGWLEKARNANPALPFVRVLLASAYGLKGETERAAAELAEARRLGGKPPSIARAKKGVYGFPKLRALSETTVFAGLRKAGVPEE